MAVDKQVVITITVLPLTKGKRKIIVSGAPAGEMPTVHSGEFAQVHQLINATWAELMKRKSQVPKLTAPKATVSAPTAEKAEATQAAGQAVSDEAPEGDQMVAPETEETPGDLPVIEGDTGADAGVPTQSAPMLSSLDEDATIND